MTEQKDSLAQDDCDEHDELVVDVMTLIADGAETNMPLEDIANNVILACRTPAETDWQIMYEAETRISAKQAAEIVQLREDLEALRAAPTKEEVELRLEVVRLRKEADLAHAEVVHTQDELGALLHAAEAKLAQALSQVENMRVSLSDAHRALVAFKDAVIARDHFRGREYVGLGIQVNDAIDKARLTLSSTVRSPEGKP